MRQDGHGGHAAARPWHALMPPAYWRVPDAFDHGLKVFEAALHATPDAPAVRYFDASLSYRRLDAESSALAASIVADGFVRGDRLAVFLQNVPAFPIAMLATWKAGGVFVPINPMNRARELAILLADAEPQCLVLEPGLYRDVYLALPEGGARPARILLASPGDYQRRDDRRVLPPAGDVVPGVPTMAEAIGRDAPPLDPDAARSPDDAAFLVYTSGTTGQPKGAIISQRAVGRASAYARETYGLAPGDAVLAIAPVFHTTGLMSTVMTALNLGGALILAYRFEAAVMIDAIGEHAPRFSAAAPTAYLALVEAAGDERDVFRSFKALAIGGAAVSPSLLERLCRDFGVMAQTGYGMTETGGAVTITPFRHRQATPIDGQSGALSIGFPLPGVDLWIADDDGRPLGAGAVGEIVVGAPTSMDAYWRRPEDTRDVLRGDGLRTGDVGLMDEDGWFYLVDRKKDVIVAGGYKVWPREVEDVLAAHPAVAEAAVVGVPDPYRGETVKAFVRLRPDSVATADELAAHCRELLAAYKRPRHFELVGALPKTITGKIVRAALREG